MLMRLLRTHLRPYQGQIVFIVLAQFVSTMASLYLPSLNGQIIDPGVAKGDTGSIVSHGGIMLAVSLVQIAAWVAATSLAAKVAMAMGRDMRGNVFGTVVGYSAQEVTRLGA